MPIDPPRPRDPNAAGTRTPPGDAYLSKDDRARLHKELLQRFPTRPDMQRFLDYRLGLSLDAISSSDSYEADLYAALRQIAASADLVRQLLTRAPAERPDQGFQAICREILLAFDARLANESDATAKRYQFTLAAALESLPPADTQLFGREQELAMITDHRNAGFAILVITAGGGIGKTALVRAWLRNMAVANEAVRFVACSFFSQGQSAQVATSDQFILETLEALGDKDPGKRSLWSRARRLGQLLASEPTVLVLDGLEPLQYGPGPLGKEGQLRDAGLETLLTVIAEEPGRLFCIVTSRLRLSHKCSDRPTWAAKELDVLPPGAARELLRYRGLHGMPADFDRAAQYLNYHSLALVLAAEYLKLFKQANVQRVFDIPLVNIPRTKAGPSCPSRSWRRTKQPLRETGTASNSRSSTCSAYSTGPRPGSA